jgi:hypothetical protein
VASAPDHLLHLTCPWRWEILECSEDWRTGLRTGLTLWCTIEPVGVGEAPVLRRPQTLYRQNGQQPPLAAAFVAVAAVDPNRPSSVAASPKSLAFIVSPLPVRDGLSVKSRAYGLQSD